MNSKGHLLFSLAKSIIRILGCVSSVVLLSDVKLALAILSASFAAAELLGIVEELVDKR